MSKTPFKHLTLAASLLLCLKAQTFCPVLTCTDNLGSRVCYQHSGDAPVTQIKVDGCKSSSQVCDLQSENKDMAWSYTDKQYWTFKGKKLSANSNVYMKNTLGYCRELSSF